VVVAAGPFQVPHVPAIAAALDPSIAQVHVHDYRRPAQLPPGGVLIVGSGQSGVQLTEELVEAGRPVTLAVGHCWRAPRTYRTKDIFWWLRMLGTKGPEVGAGLPTASQLPDPRARFACNPHVSGHGGGHDTNLRRYGAEGVRLVGRLEALEGTRVRFASDLAANLAYADTGTADPATEDTAPNAHGKAVSEVAQSDAVGGKNCNHGGAVSEAAKKDHAADKEARDAAKAARAADRAAAKAARDAARHGKHHGKPG
jgi:hypothetical protein